jgi:hypothetical protein
MGVQLHTSNLCGLAAAISVLPVLNEASEGPGLEFWNWCNRQFVFRLGARLASCPIPLWLCMSSCGLSTLKICAVQLVETAINETS